MQARHLNKIIFLLILSICFWQSAYCQIDTKQITQADSLFKSNRLLEAEAIYKKQLNTNDKEAENIKYKLAYIAKAKNDWINELAYLSSIQARQASPNIAKRLNEIGEKQEIPGYQINIIDQFQWIYFAFFPYITGFLLILALYSTIILLYKKYNKRKIRSSYLYYLISYLILLLIFANYPAFLRFGIIQKDKAYLRDFSSSAAPVRRILKKGNRITHWNTRDIWVKCYFEGDLGFIKSADFQPIN